MVGEYRHGKIWVGVMAGLLLCFPGKAETVDYPQTPGEYLYRGQVPDGGGQRSGRDAPLRLKKPTGITRGITRVKATDPSTPGKNQPKITVNKPTVKKKPSKSSRPKPPKSESPKSESRAEPANTVLDLVVRGNQRISTETIVNYSGLEQGNRISDENINDALKKLYASGLFTDVSIFFEGYVLTIEVQENPIINRIAFEGNRDIKDDSLLADIRISPRQVYSRDKIQQATQRIITLYRRSGRFSATVVPKIIRLPENRVNLVFEIREGKITRVAKISFIGNTHFSDSTLLENISTQEERWYRFFSTDDIYDPDRVRYDRELLRLYYLKNGYIDFKVVSTSASLSPDQKSFYVTFVLEEGQRYANGDISVEVDVDELKKVDFSSDILTEKGEWYDAELVSDTIAAISDHAGRYGYAFVDVEPDITRTEEKQVVSILYRIREGEKVYVERLNINGNAHTEDRVIRREILLYEGDAFNIAKLRRSRRMLQRLGLFAKIDVNNRPGSKPDQTIVDVNVVEQSTGSLSIGGGYSTSDGALGNIRIQERNFLGRGQDVTVGFTLSQRRQNVEFNFTEPYFQGYPLSAGVGAFFTERDYQRESGYTEKLIGGNTTFAYWLIPDMRQSWQYSVYQNEITDVKAGTSQYVASQKGSRLVSLLTQALSYDKRNDYTNPTDGYYLDLSTTYAGLGGDIKYFRLLSTAKYYHTFRPRWTTTLTLNGGYIKGLGNQGVRLSDRFFVGGDDLRGFHVSGIGPRDIATTDALGGNIYYVAQLEQGFPLGLPKELGIDGRVFADAGSLFDVDIKNRKSIIDDRSLRASVGVGIAWQSPFGSVRVYYANPVKKNRHDITENIRFSFGTGF